MALIFQQAGQGLWLQRRFDNMLQTDGDGFLSFKNWIFIYWLLSIGLFLPYLLFNEIVAPHRQYIEIGATDPISDSANIENRKFSDYTNSYVPEISNHLKELRSEWLTLWTNQNEAGRPMYHISGFSPAYLPSWVIAQLTDSPWRFITALSLFTCFFAGLFVVLFCREIGLAPIAGFIAGTSLAASPLFMYWLTFPMFPAVWCWSAGALWAISRSAKKPDLIGWGTLAFSTYSLLMTAYPQPVVFHGYLLGGFGMYLTCRKWQVATIEAIKFVSFSVSAVAFGSGLALPVYIDLAHISAESARVAPDTLFFTAVLPKFDSWTDVVRFFVLSTAPEIFGNPVAPDYPFPYDGLSITPLVLFFAVIGLQFSFKQTWGWWLAIIILGLFAFVHPLYVLAVKYLGFSLSRSTPLGSIMLPLTIIAAYGADGLIKRSRTGDRSLQVSIAITCVFSVITIGVGFGLNQAIAIRWDMVFVMMVVVGLLALQRQQTRPVLLMAAIITVFATVSYPLMLRQDPAHIATTSKLVEKIRTSLPPASRFAIAGPGIPVLPPNLNASLGLSSIHSYNSLSSRRYHTLIKALGGEVKTYGRYNGTISPDYSSTMFWMSNIGLILSPTKLLHENLTYIGEESGVHLHKVISRMGENLQVVFPKSTRASDLWVADPRLLPGKRASKRLDLGDILEFEVTAGALSALVLSQKFHRDWQAQVFVQSGWVPAMTTVVNGVFQGVLLPQDAVRVRLEFKPWVRYAWIAHVVWSLLLVTLILTFWRQTRARTAAEN